MPEAPYIKKLETLEDFNVWDVDGEYIRSKINREFTNFGQHFRFDFIPTKEFWIDKQHGSDEKDYFISHMLVEWFPHGQAHGTPTNYKFAESSRFSFT